MSLREEIENYLKINNYEELPYVCSVGIVSIIEKRIDELKTKHPEDLYRAYNAGLDDVKEMLK